MNETPVETPLYCAYHPNRETMLRCSRCEKPICTQCAILTPTGYRCKDCLRERQKVFDTATWLDYPLAAFVAASLAFLGSLVVGYIGFFSLLLAPLVGLVISTVVRWAVRKRRSKRLHQVAAAAAALGSLLPLLPILLALVLTFASGQAQYSVSPLLSLVWQGIYTFLVTSATYYRLSGIHLNR